MIYAIRGAAPQARFSQATSGQTPAGNTCRLGVQKPVFIPAGLILATVHSQPGPGRTRFIVRKDSRESPARAALSRACLLRRCWRIIISSQAKYAIPGTTP